MKFNYSKICSNLLSPLCSRSREILERRFGLESSEKETLDSIGGLFGITRERVRQIEQESLLIIKKDRKTLEPVLKHLESVLSKFGNIKREDILISFLGKEKEKIFFLLSLDDNLKRVLENKDFYSFWVKGKDSLNASKKIVSIVVSVLKKEKELYALKDLYQKSKKEIEKKVKKKIDLKAFESYLEVSKNIQENFEGKIGLKSWIEVNPRGVKDKAFLVFKKQKKPLHFSEVASLIKQSSFFPEKDVHLATVHNELIKDERFVLVGRGLYALKEWGYDNGTVKQVILKVLSDSEKPLTKEEITNQVLEKRLVKENTVFLNLQDKEAFSKNPDRTYSLKDVKKDIKEA